MFCRKCGANISENAKFCTACGFPTDGENAKTWGEEKKDNPEKRETICAHCGKKGILYLDTFELSDGNLICLGCSGSIRWKYMEKTGRDTLPNNFLQKNRHNITLEDVKDLEDNPETACKYDPEYLPPHMKKICGILFDDKEETIEIGSTVDYVLDLAKSLFGTSQPPRIYMYSNLVKYEYGEDQNVIRTGGSGLGRALVDGVLFGGAGAVVGAATKKTKSTEKVTQMFVQMTFKVGDEYYVRKVNLMDSSETTIKRYSQKYLNYVALGEKLLAKLDDVYCSVDNINDTENESPVKSEADVVTKSVDKVSEIRKYKELLDDDIITEEEFALMKKQLLGL